jgi:hypothetical protein
MNQLNVVLAFPSAFAPSQALVRAIKAIDAKMKIAFEQGFLVCETNDPVDLASRLGIFGIDKVAIARKVENEFEELSNAIAEIGLKVILPGEKFFVKVNAGGTNDYVSRDIEFASSGKLTAKLAEMGAHPAKNEQEADRVILAFAGKKFAYVCVEVSEGPGGLPVGSFGKALCSLHNPLSSLTCYATAKAGFVPEIVLLYSDEDELRANAKLAEILAKRTAMKEHVVRVAPIDIPNIKDVPIELVKDAIAAEVLIGQPGDRVVLPFSPAIHPLWFIEAIAGKAMAAGKTPYMPLMFTDIPKDYATKMQTAISKSKFQKYDSAIDAAAKLSIKKMKKLKVGPNYLHDILDSV